MDEILIVDCVPDTMDAGPQQAPGARGKNESTFLQPMILEMEEQEGVHLLGIVDRSGRDASGLVVHWSCSSGSLSATTGIATRWSAPDDGQVHAVMAVVERAGSVVVETWRRVPRRR
jgi:hypothetical protein